MDQQIQDLVRQWHSTHDLTILERLVQVLVRSGQTNFEQVSKTYSLPHPEIWDCLSNKPLQTRNIVKAIETELRKSFVIHSYSDMVRSAHLSAEDSLKPLNHQNYFWSRWDVSCEASNTIASSVRWPWTKERSFEIYYEDEPYFAWKQTPRIFGANVPRSITGGFASSAGPTNQVEIVSINLVPKAVQLWVEIVTHVLNGTPLDMDGVIYPVHSLESYFQLWKWDHEDLWVPYNSRQ